MPDTIICERCGAEAVRRSRAQKYCPECSEIMKKATRHKKKPAVKRNGNGGGLIAAALEANRLHISYGEYMRLQTAEEG